MAYKNTSYGGLRVTADSVILANSVTLNAGTLVTGSIASVQTIDQTYYQVQETVKFDIEFSFTGMSGVPVDVEVVGRYDGNPAHDVFIYVWDFNASGWDRITVAVNDFPSSAVEGSFKFQITPDPNYLSGGEARIRIYHDSVAISSHDMYIDYIEVTESTLAMPMAGTAYQLTGMTAENSNNMTISGANGTITIDQDGDYQFVGAISFSGQSNALIEGHLYIDDVESGTAFKRRLGATGDVGSAAGCSIIPLVSGNVLTFYFNSDLDDSFISIDQLCVQLQKLN